MGGHSDFSVKLDFEIAVDQTFKGSWTPTTHPPVPIVGQFLPNHRNMLKTMLWGALLVATNLLNTYIQVLLKLDKNWLSNEQNTICPYLGIRTKYDRFWPINWENINIFE